MMRKYRKLNGSMQVELASSNYTKEKVTNGKQGGYTIDRFLK
jgi:hypothetical protein